MGKGTHGKSSASAATRKKHAKKLAGTPEESMPKDKKTKKEKGKKSEPRQKIYIPPVKPAPLQPDPLEVTGLARTLPPDLLVVLRSFNKKAQVTKIRALEELQAGWVDKCLKEGPDGALQYTLIEMLPVWMHHVSALFLHHSRRVRVLTASLHLSLLQIPPVRDQVFFYLRESAPAAQVESILGSWCIAAHDVDKSVASLALNSWNNAIGVHPDQLKLDGTFRESLVEFVQRTALDPAGVYTYLNPVQPSITPVQSQPHSRKGSGRSTPAITVRREDPEQLIRSRIEEFEENEQDKKARLRVGALGAIRWILESSSDLPDNILGLFGNPAFTTCLNPSQSPPWIEMESFGFGQPVVRKTMWNLLRTLLSTNKGKLESIVPDLGRAILRSAWIETDISVQTSMWLPLLSFLRHYPTSWQADLSSSQKDQISSDSEDESEDEAKATSSHSQAQPQTTGSAAYEEFLQFLQGGCSGSPVQGYPVVVAILSTIPSSILASASLTPLESFFSSFWAALDRRALSSLNRSASSAAFLASLLECTVFLIRRIRSSSGADDPIVRSSGADINESTQRVAEEQLGKIWQEMLDGKLKIPDSTAASLITKTLVHLGDIDAALYTGAWDSLRTGIVSAADVHPKFVSAFLKGLDEASRESPSPPLRSLLADLSEHALQAYSADVPSPPAPDGSQTSKSALLAELLGQFGETLFENSTFTEHLDNLLSNKTHMIVEHSPSLLLSILSHWQNRECVLQTWHSVLFHIALDPQDVGKILLPLLEAAQLSRLPPYIGPKDDVFDGIVVQLLSDVLSQPSSSKTAILRGLLLHHGYFISTSGFVGLFDSIATSLKLQIDNIFEVEDEIPWSGLGILFDLTLSTYQSSASILSSRGDTTSLVTEVFLYAYLLPLCTDVPYNQSFSTARDLWKTWYSSEFATDASRTQVLQSIKEKLKYMVVSTKTLRVLPQNVLDLWSENLPEFQADSIMELLPSELESDEALENISSQAIGPGIGVIDSLLPPSSSKKRAASASSNDKRGLSSYARGIYALLLVFLKDRMTAKENIWALRHFLALSIYASDFQSMPSASSPVFDERVFEHVGTASLSELIVKVEQITAYLLLSGHAGAEPWRKYALDSLTSGKETANSEKNYLSHFLVQIINHAKESDSDRDTRVLRTVLGHVFDDVEVEDADLWVQVARKMERSAPETSMSIIHSLIDAGLEPPKLDRYRNEIAASLLGIPPSRATEEGLLALRKLAASAPDPESDVIFLPQLRAVNAVKACQRWVEEGDGGEDEEEGEEGDGVDEEVESAMLLVFAGLAPILQNVPGKHWEFIFDVVETVLESSSISDDDTLVGLARSLKMVMVIEDLTKTNKALRDDWQSRRMNVLTMIRDMATVQLDSAAVSVPRSVCRELILSIVQNLPASLVDEGTLGKLCHLVTDPSTDVQQMAYRMLKTAAQKRTEYLVIEVGVGNIAGEPSNEDEAVEEEARDKKRKQKGKEIDNQASLLPQELLQILERDVPIGLWAGEEEEEEEQEQLIFGWMLAWMLVFDLFNEASFKVKSLYIEQLRNLDLIGSRLLPSIINLLRLDQGLGKAFKIDIWGVDEFYIDAYEPSPIVSIPVLAAHLYYRALLCVPSLVHTWVLGCKDRQLSNSITTFTSQYFSPLIIRAELAHVRSPEGAAELSGEGMSVKVIGGSGGVGGNEVVATYVVDEHQLEIKLKIPVDWPLHRIEIKDEKPVGVDESRWRAWVLAVQQTIWTHNGRIVDGLSLFKKNVTLHFEGQVECAICYSIISVMDGSLPKKPCKTCKNRFHAGCLYKWFNTSHSSSCPLCRSNII